MAYKSSINTGLPNLPDPPDPKFFPEFARIYNAIRNLTIALDSYTGAMQAEKQYMNQVPLTSSVLAQNMVRVYVLFPAAVTYGQTVNLYNVAGVLNAQLSNSSAAGKPIHGWCSVVAGVAAGAYGEVMLGGLCTAIGGLTPGATYYAGNTPGTIAPTAGTVSQRVGFALSSTSIFMQPQLI